MEKSTATRIIKCAYAKDFDPRFDLTKTPYICTFKDGYCSVRWTYDSRQFCKRDMLDKK